jgi:putative endonuclease
MKDWFIYMLKCSDGTFYIGISTDINRRLEEHNNSKKGASYTRGRRPVELIYQEGPMTRSSALKREIEMKKMKREDKEKLIR